MNPQSILTSWHLPCAFRSKRRVVSPNCRHADTPFRRFVLLPYAFLVSICVHAAAENITLKFWDNQQSESGLSKYQAEAVKRFEAENPGIKVEVTTIPYPEYQQRLLTAVKGNNAPDVSTVDQIWNAAFAEAGAIEKLDDLAKQGGLSEDQYFKGAWDSCVYNNSLWGIPFNVDVWFFAYYNKKLFQEAGVDPASTATWEGLLAAAQKLTDPAKGKFGVGFFAHKGEDTVCVVDCLIHSNGGEVIGPNGKCALDQPAAVKALEFLKSVQAYSPKGMLNAASEDMRQLFLNGSLAMEFWPALEQPTLQKSGVDWDFTGGFAPAGKKPVGTYGGWNLVLYSQSKNKEAAWKFIRFLTRPDVNGAVVDLIPANKTAAQKFLQENRKNPDQIFECLQNAKPRPLSPHYLEVSEIENTMIQEILSGGNVMDAAKKASAAIDQLSGS
jgi:ABC-type glycerol-3-phosphate transport system substrate-binding protein